MINIPKFDIEKLVNDLTALNEGKNLELKFTVRTFPKAPPSPVMVFEAATGVTTTQWAIGKTPEELIENVKSHLQKVYFQLATNTQKIAGKRARDRVRLAAKLFKDIFPEPTYPMDAFTDGDFIFCTEVHRTEVKKYEDALAANGWLRQGEGWAQKPKDMKVPENQDRAAFTVRIGPVPSLWKMVNQNGRDPFEFWFDEFSA